VGRHKLRLDDLDDKLKKYGKDGWELVSLNLDADLKGSRDGQEWPGSALPTALEKRPALSAKATRGGRAAARPASPEGSKSPVVKLRIPFPREQSLRLPELSSA
jgi:hypothetical protein